MLLRAFFKIKYFCFLVVSVSLFLSCASSQHLAEIETSKIQGAEKIQGADLDKIITEIVSVIADKFYNFETKRVIALKVSDMEDTYKNKRKMPAYITHKFTKKIEKDFLQIKLVEKNYDCKLKINLFKKAEKPNIFISLVDDKNNTFSSTTYEISESEFSNPEYKNFEVISLKKTAHLKIHYQSRSDMDVLSRVYYPVDQECSINGKKYIASTNKTFFNENVSPGNYVIILSFKGGIRDTHKAYPRMNRFSKHSSSYEQKIATEKMSKTFELFLNENESKTVKAVFSYDVKEGKIEIQPFDYITYYDSDGKVLRDSTQNNTRNNTQWRFPKKELNKISALIDKYSKDEIVEMLRSRGSITTQIDGEFKVFKGSPSLEYVNSKTIYLDFKKNRISIIDAEKTLLVVKKGKEEQRRIAKAREFAEKMAIEERNNRIEAERIRKALKEEERKRQKVLKEEERKRQGELERLARFARDQETQVLPSDYHLKIRKYLRRILIDPESLQISKISKPIKYVVNKNYHDLSPGNIVYKCEVCYNSKNRFGGYTGVQCQDLIFRDGEVINSW